MKTISVTYLATGKIATPPNDNLLIEGEDNAVQIVVTYPSGIDTSYTKRAYVKNGDGGGDIVALGTTLTSTLTLGELVDGKLTVGFEVYKGTEYTRYEPLKLTVNGFVNPSGTANPNGYMVTITAGTVTIVEPDEDATVTNSGNTKDAIFDFDIPRAEKVELQKTSTQIQWKNELDVAWTDLISIAELTPDLVDNLTSTSTTEALTAKQGKVLKDLADTKANQLTTYTKTENDTLLGDKVDKVIGKQLSTEDYTTAEKSKLAGIEAEANDYTHPATHSLDIITETSTKKIMTADERTLLANQSGTNTGDQDLSAIEGDISDILDGTQQVGDSALLDGQLPSYYAKESERTPRNSTFTIVAEDTVNKDGADYICADTEGNRFNEIITTIMAEIVAEPLLQGCKIYTRNGTYYTNGDITVSQKCILEFEDEFDVAGEQSAITTIWNFTGPDITVFNGKLRGVVNVTGLSNLFINCDIIRAINIGTSGTGNEGRYTRLFNCRFNATADITIGHTNGGTFTGAECSLLNCYLVDGNIKIYSSMNRIKSCHLFGKTNQIEVLKSDLECYFEGNTKTIDDESETPVPLYNDEALAMVYCENAINYSTGGTIESELNAKIPTTEKGAVSGVVPLDETGLIPTQYIPQSAIASNAVDFYLDGTNLLGVTVNNVNEVDRLLRSPISAAEVVDTIVVNNNTVLKEVYKCTTVLPSTTINAGTWEWITYASVSNSSSTTELLASIYSHYAPTGTISITGTGTSRTVTASTGTPFAVTKINVGGTIDSDSYLETSTGLYRITARTSDTEVTISVPTTYTNQTTIAYRVYKRLFQMTTGDINNTTIALIPTLLSVQSAFTVEADSCIAIGIFGKTTRTSNTNIQYTHNGTSRYTHFHSPLLTTDYFIPLSQKGVAGGVATTDSNNYVAQNIGNNIVKYTETLTDLGTVNSGTVTLDCSVSRNWKVTVGGAVEIAFSNVPAGAVSTPIRLYITMPVSYTVTYPASLKWNYAVIPTFPTNKQTCLMFETLDNGTTWNSSKVGEY